jgi:hypothetical protein
MWLYNTVKSLTVQEWSPVSGWGVEVFSLVNEVIYIFQNHEIKNITELWSLMELSISWFQDAWEIQSMV